MSTALAVCHGVFGRVTVYRLNRPMRTHAHREGHLIFHLGGAPAILSIDGDLHRVDESVGVAINPWQPHCFSPHPPDRHSAFLVVYICDRWLDRELGKGGIRFRTNSIRFGPTLRSIAFDLADALTTGANCGSVERMLTELLDASLQESWTNGDGAHLRMERSAPADFRIRKCLRLLDEGLERGSGLDAIARGAGLSRPHFFKLFREHTGVTPALYANTMRIERALDLLVASQSSVTEVGYELGFASLSHFTHFFAAHVGIAPSMYRTIARVVSH